MGVVEGEGEDDDPDLLTARNKKASASRDDYFLNSVSAVTTSDQDSSASSNYLGNQAGNNITMVVEDIMVGTVW